MGLLGVLGSCEIITMGLLGCSKMMLECCNGVAWVFKAARTLVWGLLGCFRKLLGCYYGVARLF